MLRRETKGRARALQLLYAAETRGHRIDQALPGLARLTDPEPQVLAIAERLSAGVIERRDELDRLLQTATEHWRLERVAVVDRNILRIAAFELLTQLAPPKVAIDEALWLAHRFGTPESPAFINGVLDGLARTLGRL